MKKFVLVFLSMGLSVAALAQSANQRPYYWQQHVDYKMSVDMDVETYRFTGAQELAYTNNSPDTLNTVFYHLYFNAFQPGSEMDVRSRNLPDPDRRVQDRIMHLAPNEIGYLKVGTLKQNGVEIKHHTEGTILEVELAQPIMPGETVNFTMDFEGQVPKQIRRSGRNNGDGVALSMTQWYPKMAEYDFEGWQDHPYIAREFQGVWGDFDVKITIDKDYVIGGTGYLQNPQEIGHGYETEDMKVKRPRGKKLTWHFVAPMVHDFAWAADPEYNHDVYRMENGPELHFFYKGDEETMANWKKVQAPTAELMDFFSANVGPYPWKQYSVIQGGDGGMEYAMCTLITGGKKYGSLFGTTAHEMAHTWFQQILATNESKHEWMDEGFTSFISSLAENKINGKEGENPFEGSYRGYLYLANSDMQEPLTTQADRYSSNRTYGISAYSKGAVFLSQLGYVIGQDKLMETLKRYYNDFKFTHPTPNDIIRTAEKVSGMQLWWYLNEWTQTTHTIDYGIKNVEGEEGKTTITLERIGKMPMPLDILVEYTDGSVQSFYAPLRMMRAEKANPYEGIERQLLDDWPWVYPEYSFVIEKDKAEIKTIYVDPSGLMADTNRENNVFKAAE